MTDAPIREAVRQLARRGDLSRDAASAAFDVVMRGEAAPSQIAALLTGLRVKGETADEVAGAAMAMRRAMLRLEVDAVDRLVDTCGTGGGAITTLNVSTAAAFVTAAAGVPVAKHGNRSYTSRCGSADVLEAMGIDIALTPARARAVLRQVRLVFLFAPGYHPAMRHAAAVRKELGIATIMNLLGPLANPAGVRRQVIGVSEPERGPLVARALAALDTRHALVLHAEVGMDEISPRGRTRVWEVREGTVDTWEIEPGCYGLAHDDLDGLSGGDPGENASRLERILSREDGFAPDASARCAVALNAAATLYVSGNGWSFEESAARARATMDAGAGAVVLDRLREACRLDGSAVSISG